MPAPGPRSSPARPTIVVAGGGPAALEALLTVRERLVVRDVDLCLITPNRTFAYRPLSSVAEFATHPPHEVPVADVARSCEARLIEDVVVHVDEEAGELLTHDGDLLRFDYLLLAVGAREAKPSVGWLGWPRQGDPLLLRRLADEIEAGEAREIGVVVPAHTGWPLAGIELALILGWAARAAGSRSRVRLLVEERRPLATLGRVAEDAVEVELRRAGVEPLNGVVASETPAPGQDAGLDAVATALGRTLAARQHQERTRIEVVVGEERMEFDRILILPPSRGPGIGGLAADRGYLLTDAHGQVLGSERVWAAGNCTASPVKHSAVAVLQADAAADALAAAAGARVEPRPFQLELRGILVTGAAERWWSENMPPVEGLEPATHCLWWPPGGVVGGRLANYIAARDPSARPLLPSHPSGVALNVPLGVPRSGRARSGNVSRRSSSAAASQAEALARRNDARDRRVFALQRAELQAAQGLSESGKRLREYEAQSRDVLSHLNAAGYLVKGHP